MRRILAWLLSGCLLLLLAGCGAESPQKSSDKLQIVATLFPQYDFARQIAGEKADVSMLLLPGADSHSYDPSASDILKISDADLFLYTGKYMEPWAEQVISALAESDVKVVDVSAGITLDQEEDSDHDYDPHIWTSPLNAVQMTDTILSALCEVDSQNASYYTTNAADYQDQLKQLDQSFRDVVRGAVRTEIIFGSRFAMHYFVKEYGLTCYSAFDSCTAESEPSAKGLSDLVEKIKADQIPVVYYEELSDPKIAQTLAEETGCQILLLHSCHNVSKQEFEDGVTYLDLMKQNVENLKQGLWQ